MRRATTIALVSAGLVLGVPVAQALPYTGGPDDSHSMVAMTNDVGLGGAIVHISSATNLYMARGYAPVAIAAITVTDDPTNPGIRNGTPIVIRIPDDFGMTWDTADTNAVYGGTAAGKVGTVSYAGSGKHLLIAVTNNFSAGDTLTVSGLSFRNYLQSGSTRLEVDFDNDGGVDAYDDKSIAVSGVFHYGGADDGYGVGTMTLDRDVKIIGTLIELK